MDPMECPRNQKTEQVHYALGVYIQFTYSCTVYIPLTEFCSAGGGWAFWITFRRAEFAYLSEGHVNQVCKLEGGSATLSFS